jgi:uroporphyrinogen decarboxylase
MAIIETEFIDLAGALDLSAFWAENDACFDDTPHKPRCPISFSPDDHWLFEFLDIPSTLRYYQEKAYRDEMHRQANLLTREWVGREFFDEDTWSSAPRRIENLFECEFTYTENSTPWLTPSTDDPDEFNRILERAEKTDIRNWALPDEFLNEWEQRRRDGKILPSLGTGSRGPATIMTSVIHPETFFYWSHDRFDLLCRFRDILSRKMVELNRVLREFSEYTQPGWWITDDNSALFNVRLYRELCVPVLRAVLDEFAPGTASRYQHSDSAMSHLLDEQSALGINACNYGPTVDSGLIRKKLPHAVIHGQMPPMLLRNGSPDDIRRQVRQDFLKAGASGKLIITTAGSLATGTGVGRMLWMMSCVARETRYATQG